MNQNDPVSILTNSLKNPFVWMILIFVLLLFVIRYGAKYSFRLEQKLMYQRRRKWLTTNSKAKWKFCSLIQMFKARRGWFKEPTVKASDKLKEIWKDYDFFYDHERDCFKTILKIDRPRFFYLFCCFYGGLLLATTLLFIMVWLIS